jgi:predicted amidohydrolase
MPQVFSIDGSSSSAIICADRWLRGIEELPIMNGAEISFELSDNFESEWVPALGWYWYAPRALRNGVYVLFANTAGHGKHGHSAVIGPDGAVIAAAVGNAEELVTAIIDPAKVSRAEATRRQQHPLVGTFWREGLKILTRGADKTEPLEPYTAPEVEIKLAVAQMACSSNISENVEKMVAMIRKAAAHGSDVAVFPELAVTGARDEDVLRADEDRLGRALEQIRDASRSAGIYTVFGMPHYAGAKRTNAAFVLAPMAPS